MQPTASVELVLFAGQDLFSMSFVRNMKEL